MLKILISTIFQITIFSKSPTIAAISLLISYLVVKPPGYMSTSNKQKWEEKIMSIIPLRKNKHNLNKMPQLLAISNRQVEVQH